MPEKKKEQVLSVRDLDITFKTTAGPVHAIRGVNIDLYKGETVALVGESGSGKSVTMKAAMGILAQNAIVNSGSIQFSYHHADGSPETVDLLQKDKKWIRRHINGKRIAMVFQDPMTSLDPTMTIGKQIMEGMLWHFKMPKAEAYKKALELLEEVGITDAEKRMKNYPHQLSGGMRQRVVIAIALSCDPDLLICDEPTTALDVTIQAKILELIRSIRRSAASRSSTSPTTWALWQRWPTMWMSCTRARSWRPAPLMRSSTTPSIPTPGACCRPCLIWTPPMTVCTPSRALRRTCCMRSRAMPLHPATALPCTSMMKSILPCSRSARPTMRPPGCWTPGPPRWKCRRSWPSESAA